MVRGSVFVIVCLLGGCGDNLPPETIEDDILAQLRVLNVGTLRPDVADRGLAVAAIDDRTVAIARAINSGSELCTECVGRDPALCAAICRRTRITVELHHVGGMPEAPITVTQVFPRSMDHDVGGVDLVALGGGRVGVGWLDCDNSTCMGMFSKQSCDAHYTTLDLDAIQVGDVATLYERRFGDLQLAFDPRTARLLAVTNKQLGFGVGLRAAIYDDTATTELVPWTRLGGMSTRAASATATADGFLIVADDQNPGNPTPALPCASSCDCLGGGPTDLEAGGLWTFRIGNPNPHAERIAPGKGADGFYATREVITAVEVGDRVVVAAGQSIDRSAELFEDAGGTWRRRLVSKAPMPLWIGALGDSYRLAWLGSEPAGGAATVQRLVAGVIDGATAARGEIEPALDSHVFDAAPVVTPAGVTKTFVLRGVYGPGRVWDRFDLVEVRAHW